MKKEEMTWFGIFKGTIFVFVFFLALGIFTSLYLLLFVHFDSIEGVVDGIQKFWGAYVAGIKNALPIMLVFSCIVFLLLASWKIILDTISFFRERKSKS